MALGSHDLAKTSKSAHVERILRFNKQIGGAEGDRTPDLLTASQALSQLSYGPLKRQKIF